MFGVKESLLVDLYKASDFEGLAEKYKVDGGMKVLKYDFVLVTEEETAKLRVEEALKAAKKLGLDVKVENGLLVR